jgi:hypothetical protein
MVRWLSAAAILLPLVVQAHPIGPAPPAPPPAGVPPSYAVRPPSETAAEPSGWGLRAILPGRSIGLAPGDFRWSKGPAGGNKDVEAGYSWREGGASAVFGYGQFDLGPRPDRIGESHRFSGPREEQPGVLGFSMAFHTR